MAFHKNAEYFYNSALNSFKKGNFEYALEMIEMALSEKKNSEWLKLKGYILIFLARWEEAFKVFKEILNEKENVEIYMLAFFSGLLGGYDVTNFLKKAYNLDKRKTKTYLKSIYYYFIKSNPYTTDEERREIEKILDRI